MSEWQMKRFWSEAKAAPQEAGFGVLLDGRQVRSPAKTLLTVPTLALAEAIAGEWNDQGETLDPMTMPATRSANAALDKVAIQHNEVADMLAAYGETDLLCHRADGPDALIQQQAAAWDPLLDWSASALGAPLIPVSGIIAPDQPAPSLERLRTRLRSEDDFALTALHDLVSLSGSVVIGLAAVDGVLPPEELWQRSRIDETWQESQWGVDDEAAAHAALKRDAFLHSARFYALSRVA